MELGHCLVLQMEHFLSQILATVTLAISVGVYMRRKQKLPQDDTGAAKSGDEEAIKKR